MIELYEKCLRCGRKLKTAYSKQLGYGQICWEKMQDEKHKKLFEVNYEDKQRYGAKTPNSIEQ